MSISRFAGALVGAVLVSSFGAATARAQSPVAPMGAQNVALGPGTGVTSPVSPTGGVAASVPLSLPSARGGVPVPLSIIYTGSSRVGAAGAGWDIPLSYIHVSGSTLRRKPSVFSVDGLAAVVPDRTIVSLGGTTTVMVPRQGNDGVWIPTVSDQYFELTELTADNFELRTTSGLIYTFAPQAGLSGISLLTEVRDLAGHDRVTLTYNVHDGCAGSKEVNLEHLDYGYGPSGAALYQVRLEYASGGVPCLGRTREDPSTSRVTTVAHVTVKAFNNLSSDTATQRRITDYELQYSPDVDTGAPRLSTVLMRGEAGGTDPAVTIASYKYGAATDGNDLLFGPPVTPYGNYSSLVPYADGFAEVEGTRTSLDYPVYLTWETRFTHQVLRDFTGDGVPDLMFKKDASWHLRRGLVRDGVVTIDPTDYQWPGIDEISASATITPTGIHHEAGVVAWTSVDFLDWNGDGRLDIVDCGAGDNWKVTINDGLVGNQVASHVLYVSVKNIKDELRRQGRFDVPGWQSDALPLSRSRTWVEYHHTDTHSGHYDAVHDWTWIDDGWTSDTQSSAVDTMTEWSLRDINGDGYVDFDLGPPVLECDTTNRGCDEWDRYVDPTTQLPLDHPPHNVCVDCSCTNSEDQSLKIGACTGTSTATAAPYLNVAGTVGSPIASTFVAVGQSDRTDWWQNGVGKDDAFNSETSYQKNGLVDAAGDGLLDYVSNTGFKASEYASETIFDSDREEKCTGDPQIHYQSAQVAGYADLNGDGIPDWVARDYGGGGCNQGVCVRPGYKGPWRVRFGTGVRLGPAIFLPSDFELSKSDGLCDGTRMTTTDGLADIDGDGKPELVHVDPATHVLTARSVVLPSGPTGGSANPLTAGRLTDIFNLDGVDTQFDYFNNKNNAPISGENLPFPEVVVSSVATKVPADKGDPIATQYFAYALASLQYDPYFAHWSFPGYQRQLALTSGWIGPAYKGTMVISERTTAPPTPQTWSQIALSNRPQRESRLDGTFTISDFSHLRDQLLVPIDGDSRVHEQTTFNWGLRPLPTDDVLAGTDECAGIGDHGEWPMGDNSLCARSGIVYAASTTHWQGTAAPPALGNVSTSSEITSVDDIGRPTAITLYGDLRRTDDDICETIDYSSPSTSNNDHRYPPRVTSAVHGVHATECGWSHATWVGTAAGGHWQAGTPITIAGERFAYDGLTEGQLTMGRLTKRIVERYDVNSGAPMGEFVAEVYGYDNQGNAIAIQRTRSGTPSTSQSTIIAYDPWGATPTTVSVDATGASTMVSNDATSTWPSVAQTHTGVNGDIDIVERDGFGRPHKVSKRGTDSATHVLSQIDYDDTPGARTITTTSYSADVAADGTTSGPVRKTITRLDALGRAALSWRVLGADYSGVVVERNLRFDAMGRVLFSANPYPASGPPGLTDSSAFGTSYVYNDMGLVQRAVEATGLNTTATATNRGSDIFVTSNDYTWSNGAAIVTTRDPDNNDASSNHHNARSETVMSALGRVVQQSRYDNNTAVDRFTQTYDHLGHPTTLTRYLDPAGMTKPIAWTDTFDSLGRKTTSVTPGQQPTTATFDEWGEVLQTEWIDGVNKRDVVNTYDGLGRLTSTKAIQIRPAPATNVVESSETLTYDQIANSSLQTTGPFLGRLSSDAVAGSATAYYSYDPIGALAQESWVHFDGDTGGARKTLYHTNGQGVLQSIDTITPSATDTTAYQYDSAQRIRRVLFDNAEVFRSTSIDPLGHYLGVQLGNGALETSTYRTVGRRELTMYRVDGTDSMMRRSPTAFDALGRVTALDDVLSIPSPGHSFTNHMTYGYDVLGRLSSSATTGTDVTNDLYWYDALGNLTGHMDGINSANSRTYQSAPVTTDPDSDRLCYVGPLNSSGSCNVKYDGGGDVFMTNLGVPRYSYYDSAQRLNKLDMTTAGVRDLLYLSYGPGGSLTTEKFFHGTGNQRDVRYYGALIRGETNTNAAVFDERTIQGPLGVIATVRGAGSSRVFSYVHGDPQANRFFTDGTGKMLQSLTYDPFGAVRSATGAGATPGSINYTQQQWNAGPNEYAFGLHMLGARPYDPALGRFLQRDPLTVTASASHANPYAFSFSDPINLADPSGMSPEGGPTLVGSSVVWFFANLVPGAILTLDNWHWSGHNSDPFADMGLRIPSLNDVNGYMLKVASAPAPRWLDVGVRFAFPGVRVYDFAHEILEGSNGPLVDLDKMAHGTPEERRAEEEKFDNLMAESPNLGGVFGTLNSHADHGSAGTSEVGNLGEGDVGARPAALPAGAPPATYEPTNFASAELLEDHFERHGPEWGAGNITQAGYVRRAQTLLGTDVGGDILGATRPNGDVLRYNMRTNEFAIGRADGTIRTLFRPRDGMAYWLRQVRGL